MSTTSVNWASVARAIRALLDPPESPAVAAAPAPRVVEAVAPAPRVVERASVDALRGHPPAEHAASPSDREPGRPNLFLSADPNPNPNPSPNPSPGFEAPPIPVTAASTTAPNSGEPGVAPLSSVVSSENLRTLSDLKNAFRWD